MPKLKIMLIREVKVGGLTQRYGLMPPNRPEPKQKKKKSKKAEPESSPKTVEVERFESKYLAAASDVETMAYYNAVKKELPQGCYWLVVMGDRPIVKPGYLPIYHIGIRTFFSGRRSFRLGRFNGWLKNGGVVYRIK